MRHLFFVWVLLLAISVHAQNTPQVVHGTKITITPPAGFTTATSFAGFQNKALNASIIAAEMPAPIESSISGFNADALKTKGMVLIDKQTMKHQGMDAALLKVMQSANGVNYTKEILIFGNKNKTIIINGMYPESSKQIETDVHTALLSASYDEKIESDPLRIATFTVDTKETSFVFTSHISGSWLYTTDGKTPTQSPDMAYFIAAPSLGSTVIKDKKQFAIERMRKLPNGESIVIKQTNAVKIDQLDGYELIGEGKDSKGNKQLVYEVVLYAVDNSYYLLTGGAIKNNESYLKQFRSIANSFKEK